MSLRSLGYLVESIVVSNVEDMANALKLVKRKPVEITVTRELFSTLEPYLKKARYIYLITSVSENNITVTVAAPEVLFQLDRELHAKSQKLLNPLVFYALLFSSTMKESGTVVSQLDLLKLLLSKTSGIWLYTFISDEYHGKAYLLASGSKIHAVVYMNSLNYCGDTALRLLFYRLPYRYILYSVEAAQSSM